MLDDEDLTKTIKNTKAAIAQALVPLLKAYKNLDDWSALPESFIIEAHGTGPRGGDAGHGGNLSLIFRIDSGANEIRDAAGPVCGPVTILAQGDFEQLGLVHALAGALAKLLPLYPGYREA